MNCRHCSKTLEHLFIDLGVAPPSNAYLKASELGKPEATFPLRVMVCDQCWLVQTEDFTAAETLFADEYAYFSSVSTSWLGHSKNYVKKMVDRFHLDQASLVVEVAANDGYLLQYVRNLGIPCYGIEPTASTARTAREKGLEIIDKFFGKSLAAELVNVGKQANLMVANNVLAHVPDINDFVGGFTSLLKHDGVATFEFPHLVNLVEHKQFDTIYHEHYSYLSLTAAQKIFTANGLRIFDLEELSTHGGSLRIYAQRIDSGRHAVDNSVTDLQNREIDLGLNNIEYYAGLQQQAEQIKADFSKFLNAARQRGKTVAAYGAAAKGNTLLNYAAISSDLIPFVVDRNKLKQGQYLPGSHIPIVDESLLTEAKPDYVVILPWNLKDEISAQLAYIRDWDGKLVTVIPDLQIS